MPSRASSFIVSRPFVTCLNSVPLALWLLGLFGLLPITAGQVSILAIVPIAAPVLTLVFLWSRHPGKALAIAGLVCNLLVLIAGLVSFIFLMMHSRTDASTLGAFLFTVLWWAWTFIPLVSALAIGTRWPRGAGKKSPIESARAAHSNADA